jgi:hypothetical protein
MMAKSPVRFSLHPLTAEEALRAALRVAPEQIKALEAEEKPKKKSRPKKGN